MFTIRFLLSTAVSLNAELSELFQKHLDLISFHMEYSIYRLQFIKKMKENKIKFEEKKISNTIHV